MDAFRLLTRATSLGQRKPEKRTAAAAIAEPATLDGLQSARKKRKKNKQQSKKRLEKLEGEPMLGDDDEDDARISTVSVPSSASDSLFHGLLSTAPPTGFFSSKRADEDTAKATIETTEKTSNKARKREALELAKAQDPATYVLSTPEQRTALEKAQVRTTVLAGTVGKISAVVSTTANDDKPNKMANKKARYLSVQPLTDLTHLRNFLGLDKAVAANLQRRGFDKPTPIQLATLPVQMNLARALAVKTDETDYRDQDDVSHAHLLAVAPTGSGKTIAFLVPAIQACIEARKEAKKRGGKGGIGAVVLAPTRELAFQIAAEARKLAVGTGITVETVRKTREKRDEGAGEADDDDQDDASDDQHDRPSGDLVVATPELMRRRLASTSLTYLSRLIVDEADILLSDRFRSLTMEIWRACGSNCRLSLWSATAAAAVEQAAIDAVTLSDSPPSTSSSSSRFPLIRVVIGRKDSATSAVRHKITYAATEQGKLLGLRQLIRPTGPSDDVHTNPSNPTSGQDTAVDSTSQDLIIRPPLIVFVQTTARAITLHEELRFDIPAAAGGSSRIASLHADLPARIREATLAKFRRGEVWVLITTDLLARGLDIPAVNAVVNYDMPTTPTSYVHRAGRAGRAGRQGVVVTLYSKADIPYMRSVVNVIAAAEAEANIAVGGPDSGLADWMTDLMPKPTDMMRKELRTKGVSERRVGAKVASNARISTVSGYERRLANRKKAFRATPAAGRSL